LAWDVDRLVRLSSDLPRKHVPLGHIRELDEVWSSDDEPLTGRVILEHVRLMDEAAEDGLTIGFAIGTDPATKKSSISLLTVAKSYL